MKDLLLLPNGHWTDQQKWAAESCWEYFNVLRWVMRLDDSLRSLERRPVYDLAKAREIVDRFEGWQPGDTRAPWDLRPYRAQASYHFGRLWTEAVARGLLEEGIEPEDRENARHAKRKIDADGASTDLLIDAQTVSDLPNPELWFLLRMTHRRWEILNFLVDWLSNDEPARGPAADMEQCDYRLTTCFLRFTNTLIPFLYVMRKHSYFMHLICYSVIRCFEGRFLSANSKSWRLYAYYSLGPLS